MYYKKLIQNSNYEVRICCIYNNMIGPWSDIQKAKTLDNECESNILLGSKREKEFLNKIYEWSGYKKMELIYRASRDGFTSNSFHHKCEFQGPTICLYQNDKGYIFGGYASIPWTSNGGTLKAKNCFIFTLTNIHNTEPTKFPNKENDISLFHHPDYGPCFGNYNDIDIRADFKNNDSYTSFPCNYKDTLGKGKTIFTADFNNEVNQYKLKEVEVFKLYK